MADRRGPGTWPFLAGLRPIPKFLFEGRNAILKRKLEHWSRKLERRASVAMMIFSPTELSWEYQEGEREPRLKVTIHEYDNP